MSGAGEGGGVVPRICGQCGKEGVRQCCSACKQAFYCDRACQDANWQTHKPICKLARPAAASNKAKPESSARSRAEAAPMSTAWLESLIAEASFMAQGGGRGAQEAVGSLDRKWHEGLTHDEVFIRFIDSFRLRRDDEYTFGGDVCEFYGGGDPLPDFKSYLKLAKEKEIMPSWWNAAHERKLMKMATTHKWANVNYALEKSDVQDHYAPLKKPLEHMTLRVLAEEINGSGVCS